MIKRYRGSKVNKALLLALGLIVLVISAVGIMQMVKFQKEHFSSNTIIQEVNCSWLTVEEAEAKIREELNKQEITVTFENGKTYTIDTRCFNIQMLDTSELEAILQEQNSGKKMAKYVLSSDCFSIDSENVAKYLKRYAELHTEKMKEPQNAYIQKDAKHFFIVSEEKGNVIDFDEACNFFCEEVLKGKTEIDFSEITRVEPDLISTSPSLVSQVEHLNSILSTTINFILLDDSKVTLDINEIRNWVSKDRNGNYFIDIEGNLPTFVEKLGQKVNEATTVVTFNATGIGTITLTELGEYVVGIDKAKQIEEIERMLGSEKTYNVKPCYTGIIDFMNLDTYIELDIARQLIWLYYKGECIIDGAPCVTGNVAKRNSTPTGIFYLDWKAPNQRLKGYNKYGRLIYNVPVSYWMPFTHNSAIGFHDAKRTKFGGEIYKTNGSHGCVNLPYYVAKTLYQYIDTSIPIIIYNSEMV